MASHKEEFISAISQTYPGMLRVISSIMHVENYSLNTHTHTRTLAHVSPVDCMILPLAVFHL